jgi:hypothetical protein
MTDPDGPKTDESYGSAKLVQGSIPYQKINLYLWQCCGFGYVVSTWYMFLGILEPDPLVRGTNPDPAPSIIMQK